MKAILIKSNHGNHSGFNVKWTVLDKSDDLDYLLNKIKEHALRVSDNVTEDENGNVIDLSSNSKVLLSKNENLFSSDGVRYRIVTQDDYDNNFFNSNSGYANSEINDYFKVKYVLAYSDSKNNLRYVHAEDADDSTAFEDNAMSFDTIEDAQEYINETDFKVYIKQI